MQVSGECGVSSTRTKEELIIWNKPTSESVPMFWGASYNGFALVAREAVCLIHWVWRRRLVRYVQSNSEQLTRRNFTKREPIGECSDGMTHE